MYVVMRDWRVCFWTECSAMGPSVVCMETARPLKQGIFLLASKELRSVLVVELEAQAEEGGAECQSGQVVLFLSLNCFVVCTGYVPRKFWRLC